MTVFAGHNGVVQLRRNTQSVSFSSELQPDDINTTLTRFSFDGAEDELLTGDCITITTQDSRGLLFLPLSFWSWTSTAVPLKKASFFVNVNALGGIRVFRRFTDAVNNTRANEIALSSFAGSPLPISLSITNANFNAVGKVTGYTLNTERDAVETTSLNDKFKQQYSAGLISGNGSIDVLFGYDAADLEETPLLMLQLIQRVETGSAFESCLYLTTKNAYGSDLDIWYQFEAVVTRSGVEVNSEGIITCAIDFLTTGEVKLQVGVAPGYVLQENQSKINIGEYMLGALLKEVED